MYNLLPHNQDTYNKVMVHFETHQRAAIIQATGTGKSFVGGAVASHYDKVLIVAPNYYVLNQASVTTPHAQLMTYTYLSQRDYMPSGYNLIWFDEFHRMGAETWQQGCEKLIQSNPTAKILGSTATKERFLEQRDMAEEFFEGDIVNELSLSDAWVKHILRAPKYVIGVVTMADTHRDYANRIKNAKRLNKTQKAQAITMLDNVMLDWSQSYGVPQILEKYIDKDISRMIVFAQSIDRLNDIKKSLPMWFAQAGVKLADIYTVHSALGSMEAQEQMRAFENDDRKGVKLLLSVNMLNEGIHVDRVDGVILFRSTISKNLYLQQIGRCFAVGQKHQPLVLDFADNFTKANGYDGIYIAQDRYKNESSAYNVDLTEDSPYYTDEFEVIDTLKDTREVLAAIGKMTVTKQDFFDRLAEFDAYVAEHDGEFPPSCHPLYQFASSSIRFKAYAHYFEERGFRLNHLANKAELREMLITKHHIPSCKEDKKLHSALRNYMRGILKKGEDKELIAVINEYNLYTTPRKNLLQKHKKCIEKYMVKFNKFPNNGVECRKNHQDALTALLYIEEHDAKYIQELAGKYKINTPKEQKRHTYLEYCASVKEYKGNLIKNMNNKRKQLCASWLCHQKRKWHKLEEWQKEALIDAGIDLEDSSSTEVAIRCAKEH